MAGYVGSAAGAPIAPGKVHYVDVGAASGGDGSLSTPYDTIGAAIAVAAAGDTVFIFPGNYDVSGSITVPAHVTVTGFGSGHTPESLIGGTGFTGFILLDDCVVSNLAVGGDNSASFAFHGTRSRVEHCVSVEDNQSFNGISPAGYYFHPNSDGHNSIINSGCMGAMPIGVLCDARNADDLSVDYVIGHWFSWADGGLSAPTVTTAIEVGNIGGTKSVLHATGCIVAGVNLTTAYMSRPNSILHVAGGTVTNFNISNGLWANGGQINAAGVSVPLTSNALRLTGASSFAQVDFMYADRSAITVESGADHNNFIANSWSEMYTVTSGTSSVSQAGLAAWDGKPIVASLVDADGAIHVLNVGWNGSGTLTVNLSANTTANRRVSVVVDGNGYGV